MFEKRQGMEGDTTERCVATHEQETVCIAVGKAKESATHKTERGRRMDDRASETLTSPSFDQMQFVWKNVCDADTRGSIVFAANH